MTVSIQRAEKTVWEMIQAAEALCDVREPGDSTDEPRNVKV